MADSLMQIIVKVKDEATAPLNNISKSLGTIAKVGVAAFAAASAAVIALTKAAIDNADAMLKMSQAAGVSVETFSALNYAASLSGVSSEELSNSFVKLSKAMFEAENKTSTAAVAFRALGVSTKDSAGNLKTTEQLMMDVADQFAGMADGAAKTAIAVQLFGKSGATLIPMLNQGSDGLKEMTDQAKALGVVVSQETAVAAEKFNDNLSTLGASLRGTFNEILANHIPTLSQFSQAMADSAEKGGTLAKALNLVEGAANLIIVVLKAILTPVIAVAQSFVMLIDAIAGASAAFVAFMSGDMKQAGNILRDVQTQWANGSQEILDTAKALWIAEDAAKDAGKAVEDTTDKEKAAAEAARILAENQRKLAEETKKVDDSFNKIKNSLQEQIDGTDKLSMAHKLLVDLYGKGTEELNKFTAARKAELAVMAMQVVVNEEEAKLKEKIGHITEDATRAAERVVIGQIELQNALRGTGAATLDAQLSIVELDKSYLKLRGEIQEQIVKHAKYADVVKVLEEQLARLDAAHVSSTKALQDSAAASDKNAKTLAVVNEYIVQVREETMKLADAQEILYGLFSEGKISATEFQAALDKINTEQAQKDFEAMKEKMGDWGTFAEEAAKGMQGAFSDFFFDAMQGEITNLGDSFKKLFDRIAAEFLASQISDFLFGGFGGGGGTGYGAIGRLFGRATGGPVTKGQPYLVGEYRPEVFVPETNGRIIPSIAAAGAMGGGAPLNVSVRIDAIDSQSFLSKMSTVEREISEMVNRSVRGNRLGRA